MASRSRFRTLKAAFGASLRELRESLGLSQEQLGFDSEVHRTYISEIERGLKNPSIETLQKLAEALGTKANAISLHNALRGPSEGAA